MKLACSDSDMLQRLINSRIIIIYYNYTEKERYHIAKQALQWSGVELDMDTAGPRK